MQKCFKICVKSQIGTRGVLTCLLVWGPAELSVQSLDIRTCQRVHLWLIQNEIGCVNGVARYCWYPAGLKAHRSSNTHGELGRVCVQQERGGVGWTSLCSVPSTLPGHGKQNGSSGMIAASGLRQHLVKKLLLWKVAKKLQLWVKGSGWASLMEVEVLVCSSICRSDCE